LLQVRLYIVSNFEEIVSTFSFSGSIIRSMRRLEELLRQMVQVLNLQFLQIIVLLLI